MREIHRIQESLFDKGKMTSGQRIRKLHKEAAEIIKKYGLKIKTALKT